MASPINMSVENIQHHSNKDLEQESDHDYDTRERDTDFSDGERVDETSIDSKGEESPLEDGEIREPSHKSEKLSKILERIFQDVEIVSKQDEAQQSRFLREYELSLGPHKKALRERISIDGRNLLYHLASNRPDVYAWLVKWLVERHPGLLHEQDHNHQGALVLAFVKQKFRSIRAVLDSSIARSDLQKALNAVGPNRNNCIHLAIISKSIDTELIIKVIEKASKGSLAAKNQWGRTPIHEAVDFKKCTESRLRVLEALMEYGDSALDEITDKPDYYSVYEWHHATRRKFEETEKARGDKEKTGKNKREGGTNSVQGKGREKIEKGIRKDDAIPSKSLETWNRSQREEKPENQDKSAI